MFINVRSGGELLTKMVVLLLSYIRFGGEFDRFNDLLSGCVCGFWKNEFVFDLLVSFFFCFKGMLKKDFFSKEIYVFR